MSSDSELKEMHGIMEPYVAREMAYGGTLTKEQDEEVRKDWDRVHGVHMYTRTRPTLSLLNPLML